jgi:hypothetical protein
LIAEEEEYDDHGPAKDIVIEILFEDTASDQDVCQRIEQPQRAADAVAIACAEPSVEPIHPILVP